MGDFRKSILERERERERESLRFYYYLQRSNFVHETKYITFSIYYMRKWVANCNCQELYIWMLLSRVHTMTMGEICARIGFGQRCVESIAECDQRQSIISKCDTQTLELVQSKACIFNYSHHLCLKALPHILVSVSWVAWKQWFGWETLGWALTCIDVWFPHLVKNMVLLLSCAHTIWIYSVEV